jgi:SOS-response transcriptional repressor LexA
MHDDDQVRPLTPRQKALCQTVKQLTRDKGYAPTLRELGTALGIHHTRARMLAIEARARGHLDWSPRTSRSMRVLTMSRRRGE